jgi:hypothetical protein
MIAEKRKLFFSFSFQITGIVSTAEMGANGDAGGLPWEI